MVFYVPPGFVYFSEKTLYVAKLYKVRAMTDLFELQRHVEQQMVQAGRDAFYSNFEKAVELGRDAETQAARGILRTTVGRVAEKLEEALEQALIGKAVKGANGLKLAGYVTPEQAAMIAMKTMLVLGTEVQLLSVARRIGIRIEDEWMISNAAQVNSAWVVATERRLAMQKNHSSYTRKKMRGLAMKILNKDDRWTNDDHIKAGMALISVVIQHTRLWEVGYQKMRAQNIPMLRPSLRLLHLIERTNDELSTRNSTFGAIPLPPRPWTSVSDGVFYFMEDYTAYGLELVRTRNRKHKELLNSDRESWKHIKAANILGQTALEINPFTHGLVKEIKEAGLSVGKIPQAEVNSLPPNPFPSLKKEDMTEEQTAEFDLWRNECREIDIRNNSIIGRRLLFNRLLALADQYAEYPDGLYFGYSCDWRGRFYAVADALSPQGSDTSKGLLRFRNAEPIATKEAADWLAIQGANCFGVDKVTFPERIQWVQEHTEQICNAAKDPWAETFWMEADDPICFMAFADEWRRFTEEGYGFMSQLPIQVDGSNNGLQHFSAMLRDEVGAAATNLVSELNTPPADIYQQVADKVIARLQLLSAEGDADAQDWLDFGVNRKTCKRPVMVVPYAGTINSCTSYIYEYIMEKYEAGTPCKWRMEIDRRKAANYLSPIVWEQIGHVVRAAREAMTYIRAVLKPLAQANIPAKWRTPSGWQCYQQYNKTTAKRVHTFLEGKMIMFNLSVEQDEIDVRKSGSATAANFVHSMDASALAMTVLSANDNGITDLLMIHDSYGCHASKMGGEYGLASLLRKEFVKMYSENDVLKDLRSLVIDEIGPDVITELPDLPLRGSFDLTAVENSPYFFA
ncbi:DNA-directed RNA polymerase [Bacterioplanoides sp.]|uniref:DNA-directed RNA polymerase n=1 Tax=Bacterioplanoides sp. TaxID=2066072 RepID=UPI003B0036D0